MCMRFQITGSAEAVESAKLAVEERLKEIDAERKDRELQKFEVSVSFIQ